MWPYNRDVNKIKIKEEPIDLLIYSSPKGDGNTYQGLLMSKGYKVWYTHNKYFFKNPGPVCQNMGIELEDYIKLQIDYRKNNPKLKKLKILFSWREIIEQQISSFFQCFNVWHNKSKLDFVENSNRFDVNNVYKYINYFNNYWLKCEEDQNNFFELFPKLELSTFRKEKNYFFLETNDIDFYITRFRDIDKINSILSSIMNDKRFLDSKIVSNNSSTTKPYKNIYNLFIEKYYLPEFVYKYISSECKFLKFFLNDEEFIEYLDKWQVKIDRDKSLIIKNNYFILQNDSNKGYEKYINNTNFSLSNRFSKLPTNYFCLLYPDKHIILKNLLPNYKVNINNNLFKSIYNERIFFNTTIVDKSDYYKYDTHMNLKGTLKLFKEFINMINETSLFDKISVSLQESELKIEHKHPQEWYCYGDLLWDINIDQNKIQNINFENEVVYSTLDEYIYTNTYNKIINKYKSFSIIDKVSLQEIIIDKDAEVNWQIISKYILRNINKDNFDNDKTVLIYYDSFSCSLIPVLFKTFKECVMIKDVFNYNNNIIKKFKPDLIFDLSVLRFNI